MIAVVAATAGGSSSPQRVTGKTIAWHTISSRHLIDHTIQAHDLSAALVKSLRGAEGPNGLQGPPGPQGQKGDTGAAGETGATGAQGPKGDKGETGDIGPQGPPGLSNVSTDGPYPGVTQLQTVVDDGRMNSTEAWLGDSGATLQQSWVRCADGKVALGGGFSRADEAVSSVKGLQIVSSEPAQITADGEVVSQTGGAGFTPIAGDAAGSFVPNGWVVEGFNNNLSGVDLIVRPWVVCAPAK
jgi:hypothetical protein